MATVIIKLQYGVKLRKKQLIFVGRAMKMDMIGMVEKREVNLLIGKLTKKELAISQMNMLRRIFMQMRGI